MSNASENEKSTCDSYPFGIYTCECGTLYIWYPDSKNDSSQDYFPKSIKCICGNNAQVREKLRIKFDEIGEKLVPLFLAVSERYEFSRLLMIDAEHVHLIWNAKLK
ncbi:MAG: hypothetical protein ACXQS8_02555 [Candidatus Helarchaeales archaeon]